MRALNKLKEEKLLFYDIETAPVVKELELDTPLFDSWNYKVNKQGELSNEEVIEKYSQEAGLYPEFAKIVTIIAGKIVDGKIVLITLDDKEEVDILNRFNKLVKRNDSCKLTGFATIGFDTPFVFKRMLMHGIKAHDMLDSSGLKPWEVDEVDLAEIWKGPSFSRASLINIATALGLPSPKEDISGADVGRVYWSEGDAGLARIADYCRGDVVTTINVFKKMRLEEPLEVQSSGEFKQEPLIMKLMSGGSYGKKEKEELTSRLKGMSEDSREAAYLILDSLISRAKGKTTKFTKAHLTALKNEVNG